MCLIRVPSMRMIEPVAHLALILHAELAAQKGGDVVGLNGVNGSAGQVAVDGRQIGLPPEHDVGGILALVHAPVVSDAKGAMNRTEAAGELVQLAMQPFDLQAVGDLLGARPVGDLHESVVQQGEVDLAPAQYAGQPVVAVEVNLQPARQPGRHPHVAQPQFLIQKVEVVVQTLAIVRQQVGLAGVLVVPRLVGRARLHGREDADQPRMISALCQDLLHPVLLTHIPLAQELDRDPVFSRQMFRILAQFIPERLGEFRVIEDSDLASRTDTRSSLRRSRSWEACRTPALDPNNSASRQSDWRAARSAT